MLAKWEILQGNEWQEGQGTRDEFWRNFNAEIGVAIVQLQDGRRFVYIKEDKTHTSEWVKVR